MKQKIHREFTLVALTTILLTTVVVTAVFYSFFKKEVMEELSTCAEVLSSTGVFEGANETDAEQISARLGLEPVRISLINADGTVLYDGNVNIGGLDNHGNRPEVQQALTEGVGQSVRRSDTMGQSAFYYALRLDDGMVLRVAKETSSIWRLFASALPVVTAAAILIFIFCFGLSARATKSLMKPIEELSHHLDEHEDIMKNARMRQEFTANVSHELKTPLTSISGYAELIEHHMASPEDVPRFAGEIHHNATRLLNMINDIIKLSELDATENSTRPMDSVPLYVLAENCVDMLQLHAEKHQVTLDMEGEPCNILGNKEMIEETLYNLCDNAIRYNNPGGTVHVTVRPQGDKVLLKVADTGIGIPKEHQKRIFERFYRVDKSRSKATGGTGLGLAIVKHIVTQHGAELNLESEPGKGTTITILFENVEKSVTM